MGVYPRHTYNIDSGLETWYTALNTLKTDKDKILNLTFIGDSICEGYNVGNTLNDYKTKSFTGVVRNYFHELFQDTGQGFVPAYWPDPSQLLQHTYVDWDRWMNKGMLESYCSYTEGSTITIPFNGTGIRLYYYQGSTQYPPSTFTTQIDEGEISNHTSVGTENKTQYLDITGLENGAHSLVLTHTGTANPGLKWLIYEGMYELTNATYGIRTNCIGHAGAACYSYLDDNQVYVDSCVDAFDNDPLYCLCIGINDYGLGDASRLTKFTSGLTKMVTKIKDNGSDCLILIEETPEHFNSTWDLYRSVYYDLMEEYDCAVIDFGPRWEGRLDSLLADTVHPNVLGHKSMGFVINRVLDGQNSGRSVVGDRRLRN